MGALVEASNQHNHSGPPNTRLRHGGTVVLFRGWEGLSVPLTKCTDEDLELAPDLVTAPQRKTAQTRRTKFTVHHELMTNKVYSIQFYNERPRLHTVCVMSSN